MNTPADHSAPSLPLSVSFKPGTRAEAIGRAVLASLPLSYTTADSGAGKAATVQVIDGAADHWVKSAVVACHTAAGLIVIEPSPAHVDELIVAAAANETVVLIDSTWASNPVIESAARVFQAALTAGSRVECRVTLPCGADLPTALLHQLLLTQALVGAADRLTVQHSTPDGYHAEARVGSVVLNLSGVCTSAVPPSAAVRLLTDDGSVEVEIPTPETARPAVLTTVGAHGALQAPTLWETGHRSSWRQLLTLLRTSEQSESIAADRLRSLQDVEFAAESVIEAFQVARSVTTG